jgi:bifunctional DNase/RNase
MIPVRIHSLSIDESSDQPVVILKELEGERLVPIWIGHYEATAILLAIQGIEPPRPMTHDLMYAMVGELGYILERIEITRLEEGTFFAALILRGEERTLAVDARPSDSIALAVRAKCPIVMAEEVIVEAGVVLESQTDTEAEVAQFRDFLEHISPEDFGGSHS